VRRGLHADDLNFSTAASLLLPFPDSPNEANSKKKNSIFSTSSSKILLNRACGQ
jgi:hypothetical protein